MTKKTLTATIFGGSGFVGRQIVELLADQGARIKIASRIPEAAYFLKPLGSVGQIVPVYCDYDDPKSIAAALQDSDYVVNCVGILFEKGKKNTFARVHVDFPARIAKEAKKAGVDRFVHLSSLSADKCASQYATSKLKGEKKVLKHFPHATILRPSVIFGEDDNFFNLFAGLSKILPFLPLIGGGHTKLQPVFVGDVAKAAVRALQCPSRGPNSYLGKIYELGGPKIVSFKEVYELIFVHTKRKRPLIPLPFGIAHYQAKVMALMPKPLLTPDQVVSLKHDNVVAEKALTLKDLGITPTPMTLVLPSYLERYRPGGRFAEKNSA